MSEFGLDLIESTLTPGKPLPWFFGCEYKCKMCPIDDWHSTFYSPETLRNHVESTHESLWEYLLQTDSLESKSVLFDCQLCDAENVKRNYASVKNHLQSRHPKITFTKYARFLKIEDEEKAEERKESENVEWNLSNMDKTQSTIHGQGYKLEPSLSESFPIEKVEESFHGSVGKQLKVSNNTTQITQTKGEELVNSDSEMDKESEMKSDPIRMEENENHIVASEDMETDSEAKDDNLELTYESELGETVNDFDIKGERPFKCDICQKSFRMKSQMNRHKLRHNKVIEFFCVYCKKGFKAEHTMKWHQKEICKQRPILPPAEELETDGKYYKPSKRWNMTGGNRRIPRTPCNLNERDKPIDPLVKKLIISNHSCKLCGGLYFDELKRRNHTHFSDEKTQPEEERDSEMKSIISSLSCKDCGKVCSSKNALEIHYYEGPSHCSKCERDFSSRGSLREHMKVHTDERPSTCDICRKTFRNTAQKNEHKQKHNEVDKFFCEYCGKGSRTNSNLGHHRRKRCPLRPKLAKTRMNDQ